MLMTGEESKMDGCNGTKRVMSNRRCHRSVKQALADSYSALEPTHGGVPTYRPAFSVALTCIPWAFRLLSTLLDAYDVARGGGDGAFY